MVKGDVANKRLSVRATQKERTVLTIKYNDELSDFCRKRELYYLDVQQELLDEQTGVVSANFLNRDPLDHHLEPKKLAPIIKAKLKKIGLC